MPKEGSQVWFDVFTIPIDAPNRRPPTLPELHAAAGDHRQGVELSPSTPTQRAAAKLVDPSVRDDPAAYPPPELAKLFVTTTKDQDLLREVNRQWTGPDRRD